MTLHDSRGLAVSSDRADSLDMVEIGMKLEEAFSFSIGDDALENIKTVEDICVEAARLLGKG